MGVRRVAHGAALREVRGGRGPFGPPAITMPAWTTRTGSRGEAAPGAGGGGFLEAIDLGALVAGSACVAGPPSRWSARGA